MISLPLDKRQWHYRIVCAECSWNEPLGFGCNNVFSHYKYWRKLCKGCGVEWVYDIEMKGTIAHFRRNAFIDSMRWVPTPLSWWQFWKKRGFWEMKGYTLSGINGGSTDNEQQERERRQKAAEDFKRKYQEWKQQEENKQSKQGSVHMNGNTKFSTTELKSIKKVLMAKSHPDNGGTELAFKFVNSLFEELEL